MRNIYKSTLALAIVLLVFQLNAQRLVLIESSDDPAMPADIFPAIMGDTTDTGERVDINTTYQLEEWQGLYYDRTSRK